MIRFECPFAIFALVPILALLFWRRRSVSRTAFLLRVAAVAIAVLALADPRLMQRDPRNNVIFLVDRSASVTRTVADRDVRRILAEVAAHEPDWRYGLITFASRAELESPLGKDVPSLLARADDDRQSHLDSAVELALSTLTPGAANQLVLVSDGRLTGNVDAAITSADTSGTPISVIPVGTPVPDDVRLRQLVVPTEASVGRPIEIQVDVSAESAGPATLALYRDAALLAVRPVDLLQGRSSHSFTDTPTKAGFFEYRAVVKRDGDRVPENDTRSAMVQTLDHPSILLVGSSTSAVPELLQSAGLAFVEEGTVPPLATLSAFRQVILNGRALSDLTQDEVFGLQQFVRNLGGGLLVVQGQEQVRGFDGGPIEELLPVSFVVPELEREASLAIVYLLDRSSSMAELAGAKKKIRVLREAAAASILLLPPETLVGIVAFYDDYYWALPLQPLGDGTAAYRAIASIDAFGGTDVYYPLNDAVDRLIQADARVKHILLVSDGLATEVGRDYPQLLAKLDQHPDITLSIIATSRYPNIPFLERIVDHGRGTLYYATDFTTLPQITMQVTQRLSRSRFITGEVAVEGAAGFSPGLGAIPPLDGYVLTYPRATSTTLLWAGDDPIFSTWRAGLGSVSVLNTDLSGAWSGPWLAWSEVARLFDQFLRTTEPLVTTAAGFLPSIEVGPDETTLWVDAQDGNGAYENFLSFSARVLPDERALDVRQVAAGLYRSVFGNSSEGGYAVLVQELGSGRSFTYPFAIPYSEEFNTLGADNQTLRRIAEATGGIVLDGANRLEFVSATQSRQDTPLFPKFLGAAIALFFLDLLLRRRQRFPQRSPSGTPSRQGGIPSEGSGATR